MVQLTMKTLTIKPTVKSAKTQSIGGLHSWLHSKRLHGKLHYDVACYEDRAYEVTSRLQHTDVACRSRELRRERAIFGIFGIIASRFL